MEQRQQRSSNVILFQVKESDEENPKDWLADDLSRVCKLFENIDISKERIKVFRIGKPVNTEQGDKRPRPL